MTEYWKIIGWIIVGVIIILGIYFIIRNEKVYKLKIGMIDKMATNVIPMIDAYDLFNKIPYEKMVFSFKPIKLESWFTPEEIKSIEGNNK